MKNTLLNKLFKNFSVLIIGLAVLITLTAFFSFRFYYLNNLQKQLVTDTKLMSEILLPYLVKKDFLGLNNEIKKISKLDQMRITLISLDGKVVFDTAIDPKAMENHAGRTEVFSALHGQIGFAHHFSKTLQRDMLYVAVPLVTGQKITYVLRTSIFVADIHKLLAPLYWQIILWAILFIVIALFLAGVLARKLSSPLQELTEAAERIADGDFSVNIVASDSYEFQKLTDGFNYMSKKLQGLINDLNKQKQELSTIIESIREGFVVINETGTIIIINEIFKKIFKLADCISKYYWDVLREPALGELIKEIQQTKKTKNIELLIQDRTYQVTTAFLTGHKGLALFFCDVTELKQLETVKKDFVVNASHELRTPLTAIKGFVDTLDEELTGEQKHYLEIIKRHTERLINIVQDIMILAELEDNTAVLKLEKTELKKLIEDVFSIFEQKFKEKNLSFDLKATETVVNADPFRLQQVFINLLDNAYKYTEQGGVTINIERIENQVVITVQDTGIGIPKHELSRIFERFYVVDKSRTRAVGGTGLGLSIVKHIVLLHGGTIEVKSSPLLGTKFIIGLPG